MNKFTSIIICTYNRAHLLQRTLPSLSRQTLDSQQFEIIVVDDGSSDNTAEICKLERRRMKNLKYISTGRNVGKGSATNMGVRSASGDYLVLTDDDCIPRVDWVENMRRALEKHPLVSGCIASPSKHFFSLCHNIAEFHPFLEGRKAGPVDFIAGANMGCRRSLFEAIKGFPPENIINEDMRFVLKARNAGYQAYFAPEAVVTHDHERKSPGSIFAYSIRHASFTILVRQKYRKLLRTPFILRSPGLILAASPIIALKVTAGIYLGNRRNLRYFWTLPVVYALKVAWCWGAACGLRKWKRI